MFGGAQEELERFRWWTRKVWPWKDKDCMRSVLVALLLVFLVAGCGKPCDEFADLACGASGEESRECVKARDYAEHAPGAEQKICEQALKLASALKRK